MTAGAPATRAPAAAATLAAELRAELRRIQPRLPETWPDATLLKAELAVDSLDLVELVARVEQRYGVLVPDADLPQLVSVRAMVEYLLARAGA